MPAVGVGRSAVRSGKTIKVWLKYRGLVEVNWFGEIRACFGIEAKPTRGIASGIAFGVARMSKLQVVDSPAAVVTS